MPTDVIMPPLSQTMDVVVLAKWLKAVGEPVAKGEPLFSIETDKATLEIESPTSGVLQQILAPEKSEVAVRSRVAVIALPGEQPPAAAQGVSQSSGHLAALGLDLAIQPEHAPQSQTPSPASVAGVDRQSLPPGRRERILASPRARRLAEQEGVSLAGLTPSGPQGMIVERDVRAYLAQRSTAASIVSPAGQGHAKVRSEASSDAEPATPGGPFASRDASSAHFDVAAPTWPHGAAVTTFLREADVTELLALQERILAALPATAPRLTITDLLVSIVGRQLGRHPRLNALVAGDSLTLSQETHIAISVEAERGLLKPVLRDADHKRPLELARERERLARRARSGELSPEELGGGTFTIVDMGAMRIDAFTPSITPPQVATLGVGRVRPAHAGARQVMSLALTVDRRFVDDAPAAGFLADVVEWIENPYLML